MRSLGSDNHHGVHPKILESLSKVNSNHDASYGTDETSKKLRSLIKDFFGPDFDSFHCFNGTAANVLCLKALIKSYESVFCTDVSHLNLDECGAPEFHLGAKLITLKHKDGKLKPEQILKNLIRLGDQHYSQPKAVSITQPTELGTCYSLEEIKKISDLCKEHNLRLHIDGARLANALYTLNCKFSDIAQYADAISFGGTKNGLLGSELILIKKSYSKNFKFIRKQLMQLPSKTRFLAIQFIEYLSNELYLEIAKTACDSAKKLAQNLGVTPNYPVESNAVFINLPKDAIKSLKKINFFYVWNSETSEVRLMTGFDTKESEIEAFSKEFLTLNKG